MIVSIFEYGVGNLHSLARSLQAGGAEVRIESDPRVVLTGDALVLPGVGAFGAAAALLAPAAPMLRQAMIDGFPTLGICLGMQLLFESSEEGPGAGLGVLPGTVRRLQAPRVPHTGWNAVEHLPDPLFQGVDSLIAYFANSYIAEPRDPAAIIGWTEYAGRQFTSAVRRGRTWGVQFHPEKSGQAGQKVIRNFLAQVRP